MAIEKKKLNRILLFAPAIEFLRSRPMNEFFKRNEFQNGK
jgi:hypothetical protein